MQDSSLTPAPDAINCPACMVHVFQSEPLCKNCAYPLQGTTDEQQQFFNERQIKQIDFDTHEMQIEKAGKTLYWIAGITFFGEIIALGMNKNQVNPGLAIGIGAFTSSVFIVLGYWSRTKPTAAIITGLCVFIAMHLLAAIGDPTTIVKGVVFKIFMIIYLIRGVKSSLEADKMIKEHNFTSYR
jgi:hypothetical protein